MKRLFVAGGMLLSLALFGGEAAAQTGTARGKVVDEKDQAIESATVTLEYQGGVTRKNETKTNKKGEFIQVGLPPGVYKFTASKEGFQSGFVEQRVSLGDATTLPDMKLRTLESARKAAAAAGDGGALAASFRSAAELLQQGKLDEADAAFKEIQSHNPSIAEVPYNLGIIANRRKDWPAAENYFKRAIELKPDFGDAYASLAGVYQATGQPQKAEEVMKAAGEAMGSDPNVMFNQAVLLLNQGKYAEAEEIFKKVEAADAKNSEVQYHLATIALNLGKSDECVARLEKYIASNPTNATNLQTAQGLLAALKPKK